jgi:hypothetical protein
MGLDLMANNAISEMNLKKLTSRPSRKNHPLLEIN